MQFVEHSHCEWARTFVLNMTCMHGVHVCYVKQNQFMDRDLVQVMFTTVSRASVVGCRPRLHGKR